MEKGKKRETETSTPGDRSTEQHDTKRQRLNPLLEVESFQEISNNQEREEGQQTGTVSGASTTSQRKELQKQKSMEISSFKPPVKEAKDIKKIFINIKDRKSVV